MGADGSDFHPIRSDSVPAAADLAPFPETPCHSNPGPGWGDYELLAPLGAGGMGEVTGDAIDARAGCRDQGPAQRLVARS